MARKPNYNFEKLKKERDRKAKKDAKREDRLQRKRQGSIEPPATGEPATWPPHGTNPERGAP